jgi:choline dehydrogenase-like flavoprotein
MATCAFDLVVLGSGFAGYEIARVAAGLGRRVLVVEKGADDLTRADPAESRVAAIDEPIRSGGFDFGVEVPPAFDGVPRYIGLGGTAELWSGKWRRLDAVDLTRERQGRRWPIGPDELDAWYARVAADYGVPVWEPDPAFDRAREAAEREGLRLIEMYEERQPTRLRARWQALVDEGVEVWCRADVLRGVLSGRRAMDGPDRLKGIVVRRGGVDTVVEAGDVVVACGGIESIAVSHRLRPDRRGGPARYGGFADHPKAFVGSVAAPRRHWIVDALQRAHAGHGRLAAFGLPEAEVAARGGGNHTLFVVPDGGEPSDVPARLMLSLEQFPEDGNHIRIAPESAVAWRVSESTRADARTFLSAAVPRLAALLGSAATAADGEPAWRGASHHAAALPMGPPGRGYLDASCRFHDVPNLACVSSAVFPLAGSANPTMTILALARRWADTTYGAR